MRFVFFSKSTKGVFSVKKRVKLVNYWSELPYFNQTTTIKRVSISSRMLDWTAQWNSSGITRLRILIYWAYKSFNESMFTIKIIYIFWKQTISIMNIIQLNDFRWGEYKDWSTHGTWYWPRHTRWISCSMGWSILVFTEIESH